MLPQIDEMSEASFLNDTTVDNMTEYNEDEKESCAGSETGFETQSNSTAGAATNVINTNTMS